ncbi:hypothetical protein SKAU_G00257880 [Synaphobranchus kaupii]|uniref:Uncharacterized protein n=1 Tax=Synaphobranchus kaupii TaxID=118154 RepID=A0A9Q1F455_SYNKA|nr:hypothetical protein SKAU_G00257880 [Synaphobranchus kaupii]
MTSKNLTAPRRAGPTCLTTVQRPGTNSSPDASALVKDNGRSLPNLTRKPTRTRGEHASSTQRGPGPGFKPRASFLRDGSANHCTTVPPHAII